MIFVPVRPEWDIGRAILSGLRRPDTPPTLPRTGPRMSDTDRRDFCLCPSTPATAQLPSPSFEATFLKRAPAAPSSEKDIADRPAAPSVQSTERTAQRRTALGQRISAEIPGTTLLRKNPPSGIFPDAGTGPDRRETTSRGSKTRPPAPNHPEHIRISAPAARRSLPPRNERRRSINAPRPSSPRRRIRR